MNTHTAGQPTGNRTIRKGGTDVQHDPDHGWRCDGAFVRARRVALSAGVLLTVSLAGSPAIAIEGGLGAYFLGTRDSLSGIAPPPGTYVTDTFYFLRGEAPTLSISGLAVARPEIELSINKVDIAHFFEETILGGTPGVVLTVPYGWGGLEASGAAGRFSGRVEDTNNGLADLAATAILGWHSGTVHTSVGVTLFAPTAAYDLATVSLRPEPDIENFLNFSKNRFAILPVVATTWLDPATGFELSGALSLEASFRNSATDWQSAPILNFEAAAMQHLSNGWAFGVAGYYSQQIGEDSGKGPDDFKRIVDARSLQAEVFGIGPILTYQTKFDDTAVNFKLKYTEEFGAKRRFESSVVTASFGLSF